jgi:hypothetical protein
MCGQSAENCLLCYLRAGQRRDVLGLLLVVRGAGQVALKESLLLLVTLHKHLGYSSQPGYLIAGLAHSWVT